MKMRIAILTFAVALLSMARSQDIDSPYPSRTTILALSDRPKANASISNHIRTHTRDRIVLGYVTPWNPKGTTLSELYRGKFDIISPAWHTVDVVHTGGKTFYQVGGAVPSVADEEWMRRMQKEAKDGNGRTLPAIKITPRYVLDRFSPEDLVELLGSDDYMEAVSRTIMESVEENKYDGIVFECAAVWAIERLVNNLAEKLHDRGKTITSVIPAMKQDSDSQTIQSNRITEHAMATLSPIVDYMMIMTYDHAGLQGRMYQDVYNVSDLPEKSPLRQDGVRCPGPNTPLDFLTINAEQLSGDLELLSEPMVMQNSAGFKIKTDGIQRKMLMGFSLYGYTYPIGWFDQSSNSSQGVPRIPPSSPIGSKDNDTEAQAASREKAKKWELQTSTIVPVLRFPAQAFKQDDLVSVLKANKALIRLDESSQEQYFDYVATMPESQQPELTEEEKKQTKGKPLASYYRAYFPSAHTIKRRLQALENFPEIGISAWDVGQAGEWLLQNL